MNKRMLQGFLKPHLQKKAFCKFYGFYNDLVLPLGQMQSIDDFHINKVVLGTMSLTLG
jgi:hypothetical protein